MALENEYRLIISNHEKMTWTPLRWKYALITELGIRYYKEVDKGMEISIPEHSFKLMALWLFFQYFKASVFTGPQCMEVIKMAFQIVKDEDSAIGESVQVIKQWRRDNDEKIQTINYQNTKWRREVTKYDRLIYGRMRLKEVEIHQIFYWSQPNLTFEQNVRSVSYRLGVSERGIKKILREHGDYENNLWGYLWVLKEDMDTKFEEELKWTEKARSKTLTKKERKSFWRKHSIVDPRKVFRTFTSSEPDLIPSSNPLLTDETCIAPKIEEAASTYWQKDIHSQNDIMRNPLKMGGLLYSSLLNINFNVHI